jgi:hypothetical protein
MVIGVFVFAMCAVLLPAAATSTISDKLGFNVDDSIAAAQDVLSIIRYRYELNTTRGFNLFKTLENVGEDTWDLYKYKFAKKILDRNSEFIMTFGGSSVTAGHDNKFSDSYPMIVSKRMTPLLASVGIDMKVRNIAMGANNCVPYNLCLESMGGLDTDFVSWEQGYNCGHDEAVFELVGRIAAFSANHAVAHYVQSGSWKPSCPPSETQPPYR